jgi:hypothetical protein
MFRQRFRFKHATTLQEHLAEDTKRLREKVKLLAPGPALNAALEKIRQNEIASHLSNSVVSRRAWRRNGSHKRHPRVVNLVQLV